VNVLAADDRLDTVYRHSGPFVTVYLDASRSTQNAAHEIDVRWAHVRSELEAQGADGASLEAIARAIAADTGTPGRHGLVAVAADGELCFVDDLREAPARSSGSVAALPHVLPYLAQRAADEPHVVVVADRGGADIFVVDERGRAAEDTVEGRTGYPMHRTGRDDWSERHFQQRVENTWESNARDVADALSRATARSTATLVVIAGDVRARHLIAEALGSTPGVTVRTIEAGGRADGASAEALADAVHGEILRHAWAQRREVLEHLQQNLGRGEYAVAGIEAVVRALRMSQADTVVISDDPSSTITAWVGPNATEFGLDDSEAADLGVASVDHVRFDAALVRAVYGTGARLVVTPGAHDYLPEGIGALLRYDAAAR
jgi:ribosomal protein L7Ae-like RNA K-turn-binding protein